VWWEIKDGVEERSRKKMQRAGERWCSARVERCGRVSVAERG